MNDFSNKNEEEGEENEFLKECEQAILDRDEKIDALITELNEKKSKINKNKNLEHSINKTAKNFKKLQKWIENMENQKIHKLSSINNKLQEDNKQLELKNLLLTERQNQSKKNLILLAKKLKSNITELKFELNEIKTKQSTYNHDFSQLFCKSTENFKYCSPESTKYIPTLESEINRSYESKHFTTPNKTLDMRTVRLHENIDEPKPTKKKNASTNTNFFEESRKMKEKHAYLKDEYRRRSAVIHSILKSLNIKNVEKMKKMLIEKVNFIQSDFFLFII